MLSRESYIKELELARNTSDENIIRKLFRSPLMRVRRALAKNPHTPTEIINQLVVDPVLNVSYIASTHPNCTEQRDISKPLNECVLCTIPEHTLHNHSCPRK